MKPRKLHDADDAEWDEKKRRRDEDVRLRLEALRNRINSLPKGARLAEYVALLSMPIKRTWQMIGMDVLAEGEVSNDTAIECCIDANRLATFGGKDGEGEVADKLVGDAVDQFGYSRLLRVLDRHIPLN